MTLIWLAEIDEGRLRSWSLVEDNASNRLRFGIEKA